MLNPEHLRGLWILEQAIANMGVWFHAGEKFPDVIFVGLSNVMLFSPPTSNDGKPCETGVPDSRFLVSLHSPSAVLLLRNRGAPDSVKDWWPADIDRCTITSWDEWKALLAVADERKVWFETDTPPDGVPFALWSGEVGIAVVAQQVSLKGSRGDIPLEEIEGRWVRWWDYFHEYKRAQARGNPLPRDPRCEAHLTEEEFLPMLRKMAAEGSVPSEVLHKIEAAIGCKI